ncbi:MAG: AAA family ATPase [Nitrospiraceae bacterium]
MYEKYYQLKAKPFTLLPDPEFLFLGTRHKMAMSLLEYGLVNGSAFIVITGEPGTGKTTLLNRLLDQSRHQWTIGMLANTHGGFGGLMPWITASFGMETKGKNEVDLFHEFARFLEGEQAAGRRVLLVLDEAQNVGSAMLEELRLLSNLNDGHRRSLQILLSGQPALRELLEGPGMEQFAQRIAVEYALEPLAEEEAIAYIGHRVRVAGGRRSLFSTLASRKIFALTGGIPRLMNQLCDHALVYGYAAQIEMITAQVVLDAARVRDRNGFLPFRAVPDAIEPSPNELNVEADEVAAHTSAGSKPGASSTVTEPTPTANSSATYHKPIELKQTGELSRPPAAPMPNAKPALGDEAALYKRGVAFKEAGAFKQAMIYFEQAGRDSGISVKARTQIALCLKGSGRMTEAVAALQKLWNSEQGIPQERRQIRYLLARTLEASGRPEDALVHYEALSQEQSEYRDVTDRLGRLSGRRTSDLLATVTGGGSWMKFLARSWGQFLRSTS